MDFDVGLIFRKVRYTRPMGGNDKKALCDEWGD